MWFADATMSRMQEMRLLFVQLIAAILLASLEWLAVRYDLFWRWFWFDDVMHFLGGFCVGLFVAWLYARRALSINFAACILGAFLIGVAWEVFEYVLHIAQSQWFSYPVDTVKDLSMDCLGGALSVYLARWIART